MRKTYGVGMALLVGILFVGATVQAAETKVDVTGVHLCCGKCVKAVEAAVKGVADASCAVDKKSGKVSLTAKDSETAQKALDAMAAAGIHGATGDEKLKMKEDSGAKAGAVKKLALSGIHLCCGKCVKAVVAAVKNVKGVTGNTAKAKSDAFEVTGDFDALELVKALNAAGFHVKVSE